MDKDDSGTGGQVGLAEPRKKSKIVKKGRLPDEEEAERLSETESEAKTSSAKPSVSKKELQDDEEEVESTTLPIAITAQSLDISSQSRHRSVVPKKGVEEEHGDTENKNETTPVSTATEKQLLASENPAAAEATAAPIPKQSSRNLNGVEPTTGRPSIVTTPPPKSIRISAEVPKSKPISHLAHDNSEAGQGVSDPSTPDTSLLVGLIFAVILVSVVGFLGIKRLNAIKRRREYRKMNDFLIDGMYNDLWLRNQKLFVNY